MLPVDMALSADEVLLQITSSREEASSRRSAIVEETRKLRAAEPNDRVKMISKTMKAFQQHVDWLTERALYAEDAFMSASSMAHLPRLAQPDAHGAADELNEGGHSPDERSGGESVSDREELSLSTLAAARARSRELEAELVTMRRQLEAAEAATAAATAAEVDAGLKAIAASERADAADEAARAAMVRADAADERASSASAAAEADVARAAAAATCSRALSRSVITSASFFSVPACGRGAG